MMGAKFMDLPTEYAMLRNSCILKFRSHQIIYTLSDMICDASTCAGCRYLDQNEQDDQATSFAEFVANCQHAKCKVVRLVRQQISKLQNTQYERFLIINDGRDEINEESKSKSFSKIHEEPYNEVREIYNEMHKPYNEVEDTIQVQDEIYEMQKPVAVVKQTGGIENATTNITTPSFHCVASPTRAVNRKWMLWILNRVRHRAHLILVAVVVGVIAWTALVYGVFLGATACESNRICFASSFKHMHTKRSLF